MAPRSPVSPGHRMAPQAPSWDEYKAHREAGLTPRGRDVSSQSTRWQGRDSRHKKGPELLSHLCQGPPMVPPPSVSSQNMHISEGKQEPHNRFCALFPTGCDSGPCATVPAPEHGSTPTAHGTTRTKSKSQGRPQGLPNPHPNWRDRRIQRIVTHES